ncbi:glycoside hydrolase family 25 protein, partial [Paenibacillus sp. NPDC101420]
LATIEKRLNISGKETYAINYTEAITAAKAVGVITTSAEKSKLELNVIQMLYNMGLFAKGDK